MKEQKILIEGPLNEAMIDDINAQWCRDRQIGAKAWFIGQVRDDKIQAGAVINIEYSAHESMAEKEFLRIITEVKEATAVKDIFIRHSLGIVPSGRCSLIVGVAGVHRKEVFTALEKTVEEIKAGVPIFGKEFASNEGYQWKENQF